MAKGKSFKGAMEQAGQPAAMAFITQSQEEREQLTAADTAEELKSKRLNLLIKPSTHRNMAKIATMQRVSLNELINKVMEDYVAAHTDKVDAYNATFGEEI